MPDRVADILQSLSISVTREQFEHLAVKFDIMNNGCVSYHNFLRHFLLNLKPAEAKRAFERRKLPLPVTPVKMVCYSAIQCMFVPNPSSILEQTSYLAGTLENNII